VVPLLGKPGLKGLSEKRRVVSQLRLERFDMAVLLPNSFESALLVYLAGIPRRIGYVRDGRAALLTDPIALPKPGEIPRHERYYYPEMLRRAGILAELPLFDQILFDGIPSSHARGTALLQARGLGGPVVGVSPGAAFGGAKRWSSDSFSEAARILAAKTGASVAVFGSASERALCEDVAFATGGINLAGLTSLRDFIDMVAACKVFLANDSGAMHIAAALGTPCVTVFGPTDETGTGPVGRTARIIREPVGCAPCKLREYPLEHQCMAGVPATRVVNEALSLLDIASRW
jgi:heptosyltransferase-2